MKASKLKSETVHIRGCNEPTPNLMAPKNVQMTSEEGDLVHNSNQPVSRPVYSVHPDAADSNNRPFTGLNSDLQVVCQLCTKELSASGLIFHMAMHFVHFSNSTVPLTKKSIEISDSQEELVYSVENFYTQFCRRPGMRHALLLQTVISTQSKFTHLFNHYEADAETVLLLAIENLAQNILVKKPLFQVINDKWFRLNRIKEEQNLSKNVCTICNKRFILKSSCDLHIRLSHGVNDQIAINSDFQLNNLLCEVTTPLLRTSPVNNKWSIPCEQNFTSTSLVEPMNPNDLSPSCATSLLPSLKTTLDRLMQSTLTEFSPHTPPTVEDPHISSTEILQSVNNLLPFNQTKNNRDILCYQVFDSDLVSDSGSAKQMSGPPRRVRTRLSEVQLMVLRSYFDINNSPSEDKMAEICHKTGLQAKVVKHWFRNTLFKERQKNKDNPYNFSVPPSTSLNLEVYEKTGRIEVRPASADLVSSENSNTRTHHNAHASGDNNTQFHVSKIPQSSNFYPTLCHFETSSEALSIPTSDTDSSSITGFPSTPPVKRCGMFDNHEEPNQETPPTKRLRKHTADALEITEAVSTSSSQKMNHSQLQAQHEKLIENFASTVPDISHLLHSTPFTLPLVNFPHFLNDTTDAPDQGFGFLNIQQPSNPLCNTTDTDIPLDLSTSKSLNPVPSGNATTVTSFNFHDAVSPYVRSPKELSSSFNHVFIKHSTPTGIQQNPASQPNQGATHGTRRNRTSITLLQSRCMHSIYAYHKTPSVHECDRLGSMIGLTRRVVQVWFQNQRAKEKKMARVSSLYSSGATGLQQMGNFTSTISVDPGYCHMCCSPIPSDIADNQKSSLDSGMNQQTNTLASHASFVDHLFSQTHLKNMISWCSAEVSSG